MLFIETVQIVMHCFVACSGPERLHAPGRRSYIRWRAQTTPKWGVCTF